MSKGWIGVDFDGTLAEHHGFQGEGHLGAPVWPMVERVKQWRRDGYEVRIVTARVGLQGHFKTSTDESKEGIEQWCLEHLGEILPVTCSKDYQMIELWDDRCVQVEPNTGEPTTYWVSRT